MVAGVASFEATLVDPPIELAFTINTGMIVLSTILFIPFGTYSMECHKIYQFTAVAGSIM